MTSKIKKRYQNELENLKKESEEFREQYAIQMRETIVRLENVLFTNVK
jgi:predicted ATP-binding protein involved in virulence